MKKILILLFLVLASCGAARKVNVEKVSSVVKADSSAVTKKESVTTQDNYISIVIDTDELEIVPIDTTKSMQVDGKTYKNVKLRHKKTKKVLLDTTKIKVAEKALIKVNVKKDIEAKSNKKAIDKKANYSIYVLWFSILLIIALAFYAYKKIKNPLF
jgi:hypothetical protein